MASHDPYFSSSSASHSAPSSSSSSSSSSSASSSTSSPSSSFSSTSLLALLFFFFIFIVDASIAVDELAYEIQAGIELVNKEPSIVIAQPNNPLWLNCSVSPTSHARSVVWKKNGNTIAPRGRISILQNHTLYFRQVVNRRKKGRKRNDEGIYDCYVRNDYGTVLAARIKLLIAGIQSSYTKQPQSQVAYVGGVATFQCSIKAVPHAVYVWDKDKTQLSNNPRYTTLPSGILQIYNVKKSDIGSYRCRSYHGALQQLPNQVSKFQWRDSAEANLDVQDSQKPRTPRFLIQSSDVKVMAGGTAVLVCIADGRPLPKITWSREDGAKIQASRMKILPGGSVQLSNVGLKDSGHYICTATSAGFTISAVISLQVQAEPKILNELTHRAYPQAHVVDFLCRYDAVPFPTLTWLFNGHKIKADSRISIIQKKDDISLLRIIHSQETDSGYYQCLAENSVGYSSALSRLKIEVNVKAPNPPRNVTLHTVSMNALNISWVPPISRPCCPINTYSVHCSTKSKPGGDHLVNKKTYLVLKELEPFTNYTCYVTAYNHYGASSHSNIVSEFTPDATPLVAPNVHVVSKTPTSIKIKWDEMARVYRRGVVSQYRVYYKANNRTNMEKFKRPPVREYLITDLLPDTVYYIRLLAGTSAGFPVLYDSDWRWVVTNTLSMKTPVKPPQNLRVVVENVSSVVVHWEYPNTSTIDGFILQVYIADEPGKKFVYTLSNNVTSLPLNNLENNTYYQVSVSATSKESSSIQVTQVFHTSTQASVPLAPQMVVARPISPFAVNLTWYRPPGAAVAGTAAANVTYTVRWSPISSSTNNGGSTENTFETNLTSVIIKGLQPYTEYQFSVRSHSANEKGPYSKLAIARTNEGAVCRNSFRGPTMQNEMLCHLCGRFFKDFLVPTMPTKVSWLPVGAGKVKVEWDPPLYTNGAILTYTVAYSVDKQSPLSSWIRVFQNGTVTALTLDKLKSKIYYMKMWANTTAGRGDTTEVIMVDITSSPDPTASVAVPPSTTASSHGFTASHAGIVIGSVVLVICILLAICLSCFRHRWCKRQNLALDSHIRSNGHGPNHTISVMHELESRTPMLIRLSENENSDAKGGGQLIFTSSGTPINGYRVNTSALNGHIPNGHTATFISAVTNTNTAPPTPPLLQQQQQPPPPPSPSSPATGINNSCSGSNRGGKEDRFFAGIAPSMTTTATTTSTPTTTTCSRPADEAERDEEHGIGGSGGGAEANRVEELQGLDQTEPLLSKSTTEPQQHHHHQHHQHPPHKQQQQQQQSTSKAALKKKQDRSSNVVVDGDDTETSGDGRSGGGGGYPRGRDVVEELDSTGTNVTPTAAATTTLLPLSPSPTHHNNKTSSTTTNNNNTTITTTTTGRGTTGGSGGCQPNVNGCENGTTTHPATTVSQPSPPPSLSSSSPPLTLGGSTPAATITSSSSRGPHSATEESSHHHNNHHHHHNSTSESSPHHHQPLPPSPPPPPHHNCNNGTTTPSSPKSPRSHPTQQQQQQSPQEVFYNNSHNSNGGEVVGLLPNNHHHHNNYYSPNHNNAYLPPAPNNTTTTTNNRHSNGSLGEKIAAATTTTTSTPGELNNHNHNNHHHHHHNNSWQSPPSMPPPPSQRPLLADQDGRHCPSPPPSPPSNPSALLLLMQDSSGVGGGGDGVVTTNGNNNNMMMKACVKRPTAILAGNLELDMV